MLINLPQLISTRTEDEISANKDTTFILQHFFTPKNKKTSALEDCKHSLQQSKDSKEDLIFKDDLPEFIDNWHSVLCGEESGTKL